MKPQKIKLPNIIGTDFADKIVGSSNPKEINRLAGDDILFGYGDRSGVGGTPPRVNPAGGENADVVNGGDDAVTLRGRRAETCDASPFLMHDKIFDDIGSTSVKNLGG